MIECVQVGCSYIPFGIQRWMIAKRFGSMQFRRPAIAAGLRLQHGFELRTSRDECAKLIEDYVTLGGDMGLTEDSVTC